MNMGKRIAAALPEKTLDGAADKTGTVIRQ